MGERKIYNDQDPKAPMSLEKMKELVDQGYEFGKPPPLSEIPNKLREAPELKQPAKLKEAPELKEVRAELSNIPITLNEPPKLKDAPQLRDIPPLKEAPLPRIEGTSTEQQLRAIWGVLKSEGLDAAVLAAGGILKARWKKIFSK